MTTNNALNNSLSACSGLPISTGVSGLGTGVATALGINVGTAGSPIVNGGALGTPSSGSLVNCTGYPASAQKVVQIVNTETGAVATGTTQIPADDTIPQNTEGDQYMSLSITPTNSSNKLKIDVVVYSGNAGVAGSINTIALFQDSTANALAAMSTSQNWQAAATINGPVAFSHVMTAGTTSSTTFKVRIGPNNATTTTFNGFNSARLYGGVLASSITITEYAP